jgi:hypothetical protein
VIQHTLPPEERRHERGSHCVTQLIDNVLLKGLAQMLMLNRRCLSVRFSVHDQQGISSNRDRSYHITATVKQPAWRIRFRYIKWLRFIFPSAENVERGEVMQYTK